MSFIEKLKEDMGIEEDSKEGLKSDQNFSVQKLEEPEKEKSRKTKKPKAAEKLNSYSGERQKVKIKEELAKSGIEIQGPRDKEKVKEKKWFEPEGQLVVDVYQTDKELVIISAIAGVKPEDLNISGQGDIVTIKGKRELPVKDKERNYFYRECYWGPFSKEIILPVEADISQAEASMTEGVLIIRIPKIERKKEKKISIKRREE